MTAGPCGSLAKIRPIPEKPSSATLLGGPRRSLTGLASYVAMDKDHGAADDVDLIYSGRCLLYAELTQETAPQRYPGIQADFRLGPKWRPTVPLLASGSIDGPMEVGLLTPAVRVAM
jgi:hypothetical protein